MDVWDFHGESLQRMILVLGLCTAWIRAMLSTFRRHMLPPFSGYKLLRKAGKLCQLTS
jgi:hypothetical protein